jgi:inhibitor of KinA sporulation pathway (predicted exonuclease)
MQVPPQILRPYAVVFDLEFTAWETSMAEKWMAPGEFKEIVQIGAVKVSDKFEPIETLNLLVRPRINPVLSTYLENLTGLTSEAIAGGGVDFSEAWCSFVSFAGPLPIIAFGRDDLVLADNLRLYGLQGLPPLPPFIDLRGWLTANGVDIAGLHACDVGPAAGAAFEGHKHDGLCDALSVAAGIKALMARGAERPRAP